MCGIWCCLGEQRPDYKDLSDLVKNRGPDSTMTYQENNLTLVFHRLAIHDQSVLGLQPFFFSDETYDYILVCNGEIYNEKELRDYFSLYTESRSDCSILIPLFIKTKYDFNSFLDHLRGEYAIVLIKKKKYSDQKEIFVGTDPLGVRPLFISVSSPRIIVCSLLKGFPHEEEHVERLSPKVYVHGIFTESDKFTYNYVERNPSPWFSSPTNINVCQLLFDCVRKRLSSDRPIGCLLSGGLDSSLVAAIASQELKMRGVRLRTFSIGMEGSPDLHFAKRVATHIQSIHTEFLMEEKESLDAVRDVIWSIESWDTTTIRASVPQYLLAQKIRETTDIKVLLNGDGADECQMGYLYFHRSPSIQEAVEERNRLLDDIHLFDGLRVDRCLTRFGLEARTPFLDKEFVGFFRQVPGKFLIPNETRMEKHFIRDAFSTRHPGLLPLDVLWRTKEAFSDGVSPSSRSWFQILKTSQVDEETFYKETFYELFGNKQVIPYRWMPRWTNTNDPSARTLDFYKISASPEKSL